MKTSGSSTVEEVREAATYFAKKQSPLLQKLEEDMQQKILDANLTSMQ